MMMIIMRGKECPVDPSMEARQEGACLLAGCLTKTVLLFCVVPQTMEQLRKADRPGEEGNPTECNFTGGVALTCLLQASFLNHYYHQGRWRRPSTRRLPLKVPSDSRRLLSPSPDRFEYLSPRSPLQDLLQVQLTAAVTAGTQLNTNTLTDSE